MRGDSSISTTQTTTRGRASTAGPGPYRTPTGPLATVLAGLVLLLGAGVAVAPPAAAVDDPSRPDVRVTHGPSCRPGGLVIEVTAGSSPYVVRLATTREPGGEDEATVLPGTTVVLRTGDVAWGETIDGRLEFEARDGSGDAFVDELDVFSFTRPSSRDCAAVNDPTQPHPPPPPGAVQQVEAGVLPVGADGAEGAGPPIGAIALRAASLSSPATDAGAVSLVAAAGALVGVGTVLASVAGRSRAGARRSPRGSA